MQIRRIAHLHDNVRRQCADALQNTVRDTRLVAHNHHDRHRLPECTSDAEDDRRHRAARDAEGEHGDERAADDRVVRALGSGHALDAALAVAGGVLVPALGLVVGDDRGDLAARAGEHPDPRPHDRGAHEDGLAVPDEVAEDLAERALMRVVFCNEGLVRADEVEHLREGEKADHAGDHGDALHSL